MRVEVRQPDPQLVQRLRAAGASEISAPFLAIRGVDPGNLRSYLRPSLVDLRSPAAMADFIPAVDRIASAVRRKETIGIFGDYDCDGTTSAAILTLYLRRHGADVRPIVADRSAGYGFTEDAAGMLADGCDLIVVFDCGTQDIDAIERARGMGSDVVVFDHHTVPESVGDHPALALVNPHRPDSAFGFRGLASAGLSLYACLALRQILGGPAPMDLFELAAIGTYADVMPLREENRGIVSLGVGRLTRGSSHPGIRALVAASIRAETSITEKTVGWVLGPRINAPGRMGSAMPALRLLTATSDDEAKTAAQEVCEANDRRRVVQDEVLAAARALVRADDPAIVVAGPWHGGVIGIVAGRLAEDYGKPAFVVSTLGPRARGSARSWGGVSVYECLSAARPVLGRFGGHRAAAGFSLEHDKIAEFREAVCSLPFARQEIPSIVVDAEMDADEITLDLVAALDELRPFGAENPDPLIAIRDAYIDSARPVGEGERHLKLTISDDTANLSGIGFGLGDMDVQGRFATVIGVPMRNEFRGEVTAEIEIKRIIPNP